jgi:hypothetical protein
LGYWREDMRHIEEPHVSNNEWIRKCQYWELRWALRQINPTAIWCRTLMDITQHKGCSHETLGWFFSWNTFNESHTFDESVTSLYHFSLWEKKCLFVFWGRLFRFLEIYGPKWDFRRKCSD